MIFVVPLIFVNIFMRLVLTHGTSSVCVERMSGFLALQILMRTCSDFPVFLGIYRPILIVLMLMFGFPTAHAATAAFAVGIVLCLVFHKCRMLAGRCMPMVCSVLRPLLGIGMHVGLIAANRARAVRALLVVRRLVALQSLVFASGFVPMLRVACTPRLRISVLMLGFLIAARSKSKHARNKCESENHAQ